MGNKYIIQVCTKCNKETIHRVFKRFGKSSPGGRMRLKREVSWCMTCQKRIIKK